MRPSVGGVLLGIVCPPAYCALRKRWAGCVVTGLLQLIALWSAFMAISQGPGPLLVAGPLWLLAAGLALAKAPTGSGS